MNITNYKNRAPAIKSFSAYDTNFITGVSPVTHNIASVLLKNGVTGFIDNFGDGDLTYELSEDGIIFDDPIYLPSGSTDNLSDLSMNSIRVTWVSDTKYQLNVS